uniref:hypothetical protein n=3 Tax=Pseudomonas aeruginosa TaxID=287 RepID=UPI001F4A4142
SCARWYAGEIHGYFRPSLEKQAELESWISSEFAKHGVSDTEARQLADSFMQQAVQVSPPDEVEPLLECIMVGRSGRGGGRSSKPGNVRFNLRALIDAVASGTLGITGAQATPYLIPLVAIVFWNAIWRAMNIQLTEQEAVVVYVMWMHKDAKHEVVSSGLLQKVNDHQGKYGRSPLSSQDLTHALRNLESIGCIKKSRNGTDGWWLCEWVRPTYR